VARRKRAGMLPTACQPDNGLEAAGWVVERASPGVHDQLKHMARLVRTSSRR